MSCWVFITPWCGMGFCSTVGEGIVVGPAEGQTMLEDVVDCLSLLPFKINDLGAMMSIMTELIAKGTREGGYNIIFISPLTTVVISSWGF